MEAQRGQRVGYNQPRFSKVGMMKWNGQGNNYNNNNHEFKLERREARNKRTLVSKARQKSADYES